MQKMPITAPSIFFSVTSVVEMAHPLAIKRSNNVNKICDKKSKNSPAPRKKGEPTPLFLYDIQ